MLTDIKQIQEWGDGKGNGLKFEQSLYFGIFLTCYSKKKTAGDTQHWTENAKWQGQTWSDEKCNIFSWLQMVVSTTQHHLILLDLEELLPNYY